MSDLNDSQTAVDAGQQALDKTWSRYPWYDAKNDSLRQVTIQPDEPPVSIDFSFVQYFVWGTLAILVAIIVYFLLRTFLQSKRKAAIGAVHDAGHAQRIEALPMQVDEKETDLLAAARRHYAAGNLTRAIICYFGYQLVELDRRQLIYLTHGKTNRQYLRELGQRSDLRQLVSQTMVVSEDAFFGHHAPPPEKFEACWSRLAEFQKLVGQEGGE